MPRFPVGDKINPGAIQGARLAMDAPDLSPIGRGIQQLGAAVERFQADRSRMEGYNANLALERWNNEASVNFENNVEQSAPDGSDLVERQDKFLTDSYQKIRAGIKDPELQAKADLIFERTRGQHTLNGMAAAKGKQRSYVVSTTDDSMKSAVRLGQIKTEAQFNDYYENVIVPRVNSVIDDPLKQKEIHDQFRREMWDQFKRTNPDYAARKAGAGNYYKRLAQIESGGNPNAHNNHSGASGLYQFIPSTAKQYGLSNPFDPAQSQAAVERLTADNKAHLTKALGREPTPGELYLAHQQGAGGAAKLLANPSAKAADIVGTRAVTLNGGHANMTAGEFARMWTRKFEGVAGPESDAFSMPQGQLWEGVSPDEWNRFVNEGRASYAGYIKQTVPDELAALEHGGTYSERPPLTVEDFNTAYGEDGPAKYETYAAALDVAQQKNKYAGMTNEQIVADINERDKAVGSGEGAATRLESVEDLRRAGQAIINDRDQRYNEMQAEKRQSILAANAAFEERQKDPANYVLKHNQGVRQAWREADIRDRASYEAAVAATVSAQEAIGIPPDKIMPLPAGQAAAIAAYVIDPAKPADDRMEAMLSSVNITRDPVHQRAIFQQLVKAGVPAGSYAVVDATNRGDTGAARRLFAAAMVEPDKMAKPGDTAQLETSITAALNDPVGRIIYGYDFSDPAGAAMSGVDAGLVKSYVLQRMLNGVDQSTAIAAALADLRGGVVALSAALPIDGGALGVVPADVDQEALVHGMGIAQNVVADELAARAKAETPSVEGSDAEVLRQANDYRLEDILSQGYFRNNGSGWGYFDPYTATFVKGADGQPLKWSTDELLAMAAADTAVATAPDDSIVNQSQKIYPDPATGLDDLGLDPNSWLGDQ